ncbi:hypothetical protein HK102_001963 [Quaeritorhiza haematococci]|nr:hypothetical protein HK102_001963 [Quaeritorhiza haematococci]
MWKAIKKPPQKCGETQSDSDGKGKDSKGPSNDKADAVSIEIPPQTQTQPVQPQQPQTTTSKPDPEKKTQEDKTQAKIREHAFDFDEHLLPLSEICARYETQAKPTKPLESQGLTAEQVQARTAKHGKNTLAPPKRKPWYLRFLECLANLFNILLMAAGSGNLILYWIDSTANFSNSYIGGILIGVAFVNAGIEFYELQKINAIMNSFTTLLPPKANVIRDGKLQQILAADVVPGDVVFVRFGDKVSADMVLFHAVDLKVDNSTLTGESDPQDRRANTFHPSLTEMKTSEPGLGGDKKDNTEKQNPLDAECLLFSNTVVISGEGFGIAVRTGDSTVFGQIATLTRQEKPKRSPLSAEIRRFCKLIAYLATLTAIIFFIVSLARGRNFNNSLHFGIGIIIAWIPQGLPLTVTMLLTIAARRMADVNVLVKDLHGVETLGAITMMCTDKTGTITLNKMTVTNVWTNLYMYYAGNNPADADPGEKPIRLDVSGLAPMLHIAATCTRARFDRYDIPAAQRDVLGDATDAGLLRWAATRLANVDKLAELYPKVFEIPFTHETKTHLTIHRKAHREGGLTLHMKGAPEYVLSTCDSIFLDGKTEPLTERHRQSFTKAYNAMAHKGHRVLAFAMKQLPGTKYPENYRFSVEKKNYPTSGLCFLGLVSLEDPPKHGVREAVGEMRSAGIKVIMVTGDHPLTAEAIGRRVNLISGKTREAIAEQRNCHPSEVPESDFSTVIITGDRIANLSDQEWDNIFDKDEVIFARTSPKNKVDIVTRAQSIGHIVAVTGDGINDAAALRKADLGIAMNITGSDVSKDAASMILLDDNFATMVKGVIEGRLIFINLKKCIQYSLTHIIPEVIPYLLFVLVPIPLALTAIQVLVVDLGFELFTTLSFAWEPSESSELMMKMPPRKPVTAESVRYIRQKQAEYRQRKAHKNQEVTGSNFALHTNQAQHGFRFRSIDMLAAGGDQMELPLLGALNDSEDPAQDTDEFAVPSRWRRYFNEVKMMRHWSYWKPFLYEWKAVLTARNGERLVDSEVLSWSYLEAGLIEAGGALLAYFAVLYFSFGMTATDAYHAQKAGKVYFKPTSPDFRLLNGGELSGEQQVEAVRQAQSVYYLSLFIMQMWNLFACKARLRLPFGKFMFANLRTWYSLFAAAAWGFLIVYTPGICELFVLSNQLDPIYLLIPMSFGMFILFYATMRRLVLRRINPGKWNPEISGLNMAPSVWSLGPGK